MPHYARTQSDGGRRRRLALSIGLLLVACGEVQEPPPPRHPQPPAAVDSAPLVRIGVISRYNPVVMYTSYQPMMDYLTAHTPYRFELKLGKTYEDAVRYLRDGEVEIASLGGVTYLEAHAEFDARPVLRPLNPDGEPFYRSVFIVRDDSPLRALTDLRGRTLALASVHSTSGNLIPRHELDMAGVRMQDLAAFENLPHHDLVAKAVLEGRFDAGAVKDIVARKYRRTGLRFLHSSEPVPSVPFAIRPDLPDSVWQPVAAALLRLDPADEEDREQMRSWDEEFRYGFSRAADADYSGLRDMANRAPAGCGVGCHPQITF